MQDVLIKRLGWFASGMAMLMYASYLDQIRLNLSGADGSLLLPLAATINCLAWVGYAWLKPQKDWPMFCCNSLGVLVCGLTLLSLLF